MSGWLGGLQALQADGEDCVRVTIMDVKGSAPREIGASMLVNADEVRGSIGGGQLEYECTRLATRHLETPSRSAEAGSGPVRMRFPLGAAMGQCCGGVVDVMFEHLPAAGSDWTREALRLHVAHTPAVLVTSIPVRGCASRALVTPSGCSGAELADAVLAAARTLLEGGGDAQCLRDGDTRTLLEPIADRTLPLALFGAGHVGSALAGLLASLDYRVRWIDGRRGIFPGAAPARVTCIESEAVPREVLAMPPGAYYLVMTHSHALDYEICEQILARDDFAWCGLIGSRSKRRRFEKRLRGSGMSASRIARLTCPIGISGIDGKKPAEIAVAVAAELLQVRQADAAKARPRAAANVHLLTGGKMQPE